MEATKINNIAIKHLLLTVRLIMAKIKSLDSPSIFFSENPDNFTYWITTYNVCATCLFYIMNIMMGTYTLGFPCAHFFFVTFRKVSGKDLKQTKILDN